MKKILFIILLSSFLCCQNKVKVDAPIKPYNFDQIGLEIITNAILTNNGYDGLSYVPGKFIFYFYSNIDAAEETELYQVVTNHVAAPVMSFNGGNIDTLIISNWDMTSFQTFYIKYKLETGCQLFNYFCMIVDDTGLTNTQINYLDGSSVSGGIIINTTDVHLSIVNNGFYDSTSYSGSGIRGYVTIFYRD